MEAHLYKYLHLYSKSTPITKLSFFGVRPSNVRKYATILPEFPQQLQPRRLWGELRLVKCSQYQAAAVIAAVGAAGVE